MKMAVQPSEKKSVQISATVCGGRMRQKSVNHHCTHVSTHTKAREHACR